MAVDSSLVVHLPERGIDFDRFMSYELVGDYFTPTDAFSFQVYDDDLDKIRGHELQPAELFIDGASQLIGRIDASEIGESHAVRYMGRDYISNLTECNIDPTVTIKEGGTLFSALSLVAQPVGIDTILGDDDLPLRDIRTGKGIGGKPTAGFDSATVKDMKPEPGESIYEFCARHVARFGATLQPGSLRNELVITAPCYDQDPIHTISIVDDPTGQTQNNAYNCTARRDYSSFPTCGLFQGRGGQSGVKQEPIGFLFVLWEMIRPGVALPFSQAPGQLDLKPAKPRNPPPKPASKDDGTRGIAAAAAALSAGFARETRGGLDKLISDKRRIPGKGPFGPELYRLLFLRDKASRTDDEIERALRRAVADRLKETLTYTCTVPGHMTPEGIVYAMDTLIRVNDEIRNVHETMWVVGRTFRYSGGTGATTELRMLRTGAVQL